MPAARPLNGTDQLGEAKAPKQSRLIVCDFIMKIENMVPSQVSRWRECNPTATRPLLAAARDQKTLHVVQVVVWSMCGTAVWCHTKR